MPLNKETKLNHVGQQAKFYNHQLCADKECCLVDLRREMTVSDEW